MKWKWQNKIRRLRGKENVLRKFDTLTLNYLLIRLFYSPHKRVYVGVLDKEKHWTGVTVLINPENNKRIEVYTNIHLATLYEVES